MRIVLNPKRGVTACQLHMRSFRDGDVIVIEPWRAKAFPVLRDLVVDRSPLDRIIQAGGFVSVPTGAPPDGNSIPVSKEFAERAMDAAACIGCGAVAACPNASAMLFTSAKVAHLALLPQGQPEALSSCPRDGRCDGRRGLWWLHQLWRVRSGVPEADLGGAHRHPEPRLSPRHAARSQRRDGVGHHVTWQRTALTVSLSSAGRGRGGAARPVGRHPPPHGTGDRGRYQRGPDPRGRESH